METPPPSLAFFPLNPTSLNTSRTIGSTLAPAPLPPLTVTLMTRSMLNSCGSIRISCRVPLTATFEDAVLPLLSDPEITNFGGFTTS